MSAQQQSQRTVLAALTLACVLCFAGSSALLVGHYPVSPGILLPAIWLSGLAALALGVAFCNVPEDSTDDPAYFSSIMHGLRAEWQRPER